MLLLRAQERAGGGSTSARPGVGAAAASGTVGDGDGNPAGAGAPGDGADRATITPEDLRAFAERLECLAEQPVFSGIAFENTINEIHDQVSGWARLIAA